MRDGLWKSREFGTTWGTGIHRRDAEDAEEPFHCRDVIFDSGLVLPQRFDGIDLAGAAGGDEAGGESGGDEQGDHHGKS